MTSGLLYKTLPSALATQPGLWAQVSCFLHECHLQEACLATTLLSQHPTALTETRSVLCYSHTQSVPMESSGEGGSLQMGKRSSVCMDAGQALGVPRLAPSHCRAWMEVTGCWLRMEPSGVVPWLAIHTLFPSEELHSEAKPLKLETVTPHTCRSPPFPIPLCCYQGQSPDEKGRQDYDHRTGEVHNLWDNLRLQRKSDSRDRAAGESHAQEGLAITCTKAMNL